MMKPYADVRWTVPVATVAALSLASLAAPSEAAAQVRLIPQAGLYVPLSDLGRVGSGSEAVEIADRESTLGLGLSLEIGAAQTVGFRVNGVYGTTADVPIGGVGCPDCSVRSTVALLTGSVVLRPLPQLAVLRPYLQAGAGLKRYDFDEDDVDDEGLDAFLNDQNELTGQLGVGVELNAGFGSLLLEVSDFVSGFDLGDDDSAEENTQHDFFLTVGLALGG